MSYSSHVSRQQQRYGMVMTNSRSQPIAIAGNHHLEEELDDEREEHEKAFYEDATWRMYNRIVDHRLHSPPNQSAAPIYQNSASPSTLMHNQASPTPTTGLVRPKPRYAQPILPMIMPSYEQEPQLPFMMNAGSMYPMETSSSSDFEEEVFELEL